MLKIATIVISAIVIAFILLNLFSLIQGDINQPAVEEENNLNLQEEIVMGIEAEEFLVETLQEGSGEKTSQDGDTLVVHYTGRLLDGTVFDSSVEKGDPFQFNLGEGGVIQGWEKGMKDMKIGEKRKLTIPSEMGYGEFGSPPIIPPGAGLEFEVELIEIL